MALWFARRRASGNFMTTGGATWYKSLRIMIRTISEKKLMP
jgi:hypothetical protein